MRRRALFSLVALALVVGLAPPAQAVPTESRVTGDDTAGSYVLANTTDGSDETMARCSEGRHLGGSPRSCCGDQLRAFQAIV